MDKDAMEFAASLDYDLLVSSGAAVHGRKKIGQLPPSPHNPDVTRLQP